MKILKTILMVCLWIQPLVIQAQKELLIIPKPNEIQYLGTDSFQMNDNIELSAQEEALPVAKMFQKYLKEGQNIDVKITNGVKLSNQIRFKKNISLSKDAYSLKIEKNNITIYASSYGGWFYAVQSLRQLLDVSLTMPAVHIKDEPRFAWRAYMLDESRYFQGETFVKMVLDQMALLKMNVFHWHLTDDAGWRIEIKKYPKLTEIGSKRKSSQIGPKKWKSTSYSGEPHGGFYTQEQIKSIVAYAKDRNIMVIPEFEMPGHSSAAVASYPWLGTSGKEIEVPSKFGIHHEIYDVTKPKVQQFIKDVIDELCLLFPSEVIHIGGDEVVYKAWNESPQVQEYMREKGIKTPADLQIYFTNNVSKYIESKGKRMMGWNEIMGINVHKGAEEKEEKKNDQEAETEIAKNVIVHFWKGDLNLVTSAAQKGYTIVNSLHSNTYLDYNYDGISLKKAYDFDPIPKGLDSKYHMNISGLGCQMWTEWTPTTNDVAFQTFPRIAAYAEVGWTQKSNKDYDSFLLGLKKMSNRWRKLNINAAYDQIK